MEPPALAAGPLAPVRAAPGASAVLLLPTPRGTQPFTYHWSRAGASLDERFTTSDDAGGVRLTVSAAQTGDSGVYTLQASNTAGSDTSKIRLEVSAEEAPIGEDPPTFLRRLQDLTVKVGSRTRFLVEIISSTECKVTWYRNERRLLEAERVALARDGNFWCADVAAVSVDDAGRWTCTAENAGGRASCSAHLNVLVPKAYKRPEFVEELRALLTEQGTVSLECKVVGVPTPVLRWFKDSREIKAGDVFALTANAEDPTSLGTYTCEAVNCMGRAYSSSKVHVVGRASREGSARPTTSGITPEPPPIFTKELEDAHVKVCEHLTLGCHIVVPPWPRSVVWYNKEGKVEPGERYHVLEDGVGGYLLEISSTEWADEGEWKCVATSAGGRVGISTCYVAMDVPKNYRKPRFMENLQAVLTEEGLVSFECKVVGFPTPVLSWFKDGQELKPGDVYQLTGTNSLGSYCCIARNCMGQASSSAELTVEDIQNQLNEEEKLQLFSKNQAPKYLLGLKSVEAKIDEPFRFTVRVAIPPEPSVLWYRDDQPVDESTRCHLEKEEKGFFNLDIQNLEFLDQAEWKCVAVNDFGHSVTSCFLKLIIPRHYKKPRFLENLQAILSDEGAVNLECKVIGVPQPVLKWYKDGEELKPGDIHRIISGQDGTCCLGTYTCEAQNCMGIAASSASLLGFDDSTKTKKKITEEQPLQRNLSLSTIHEERTSQMYDTPVGDITLDDKGEISFSFDGKEVSVSLYETPDLTEEEALQIVEMYADQLSENVTEHNVVELPPLRFVKETSTSGNLLMEAIIIDVSPDYFAAPEEDLRTEADVEDLSIADENGIPQLSLDQEIEIGGENYLEKTMELLTEDKSDFAAKSSRKKSDSQRSADDFFSLSHDLSLSEEKCDDDTHFSESEPQSFASARSSTKAKSKSSKRSREEGQESSEPTKTILMKEEIAAKVSKNEEMKLLEHDLDAPVIKPKRERRTSRGSRRSSTSSEKSISKSREELLRLKMDFEQVPMELLMSNEEFKNAMVEISTSLTKIINDVQFIERDIILKSELMSSAATASRSLEIISSLISPLSEIHSIADAAKESISESREVTSSIFNSIPQPLKALQQSLTIIEKCIDMESDNKTLVKKTCVAFVEICGSEIQKVIADITSVTAKNYIKVEDKVVSEIDTVVNEMCTAIKFSAETIKARNLLTEASEIQPETPPTQEIKHLRDTQKAVFELKSPLKSLLQIVKSAESSYSFNLSKIKHSEVIMNGMSASIQDLQNALEQIETLSVKESSSSLNKYNTEVIETVMDSVLKLRCSFEQLCTEPHTEEDKYELTETLSLLHENLTEISHKIETVDKNIGQFDILQSENKLDVLQKMAQILIALENNLPRLENMPTVKSHMATFHKSLTKILEKVIESNDAKKYHTMIEICDTVNIINSSIKNLDSEDVLPLASLSNTLKIIQTNLVSNIFESELNSYIVNNISDVLVGIQEAINTAEEMSLQINSEYIQEFSAKAMDEAKVNIVLEHIDNTIAAVNIIKVIEITQELKLALMPALENICPNLEELRRCVASICPSGVELDEHVSDIPEASFAETIATPLCELNQNIIVLNQLIIENIDLIKENIGVVTAIAEPLHELHNNLEILQQDVISQYGDDLTPYEVSTNMASVVQNLQSCIVMIHEQIGIEGAEDMSTLEDVSGIKTSADTLPSDRLVLPAAEETVIEQSLLPFNYEIATTATAQTLQMLNEHIMVLQTPEIIEALDTLSEISDYSSLKSIMVGLGDLHTGIEGILHPVPIESSIDLENTANISKLAAIAEPMQEIQQSLSILDSSNIPVYENILDLPAEKVQTVFQNISELKKSLEQCMSAVLPAMEFTNNTIEISNKVSTLREVCEQLKDIFDTSKDTPSDNCLPEEVKNLETVVNSLIDATDVSKDIKIDQVKCIAEELYLKVLGVEEDIIQFTIQSPNKTSQEAKLIHMVSEVEKSIAVLEQYDFIDLSRASDITTCISPQIAAEINSESLAQIDDIAENAVNVLQDSYKEIPVADLQILEDFFKTCKNEFTILRCLISKATSHKKIIRLLQEFNSLQALVNSFTTKRLELHLSDDVNECLTNFMIHADECLQNARTSLIKIVDSQSDMLIKTPISQLETIEELKYVTESKTNTTMANVVKNLCDVVEISKCFKNSLQIAIIEELSQPNAIPRPSPEEITLMVKMDEFAITVDAQSNCTQIDDSSQKVLDKLKECINKHHDYKDALGIGKTLVILKCLAECTSILQEEFTEKKIELKSPEMKGKENLLTEVLAEMLQPLQALQTQLVNVQEQILSGAEEDSISIDISNTESIMQTMTELHKDIVQKIGLDKELLQSEDDMLMIQKVDKEIHSIQSSIKSIENVQGGQAVKEITKPIEEIEKSLQTVLVAEKDTIIKEMLPKDINSNVSSLESALEHFVHIQNDIAFISDFLKTDINKSIQLAAELKRIINLSYIELETAKVVDMKNETISKLTELLSKIDWLNIETYLEGKNTYEIHHLKCVFQIAYQLVAVLDNIKINKKLPLLTKYEQQEEVSAELLHYIDQYIELTEIIEEISAVIKLEDIKETFDIARELRESIVSLDNQQSEETNCNARAEQSRLAQRLQTALSALQVQVLDSTHELAPSLSTSALQGIAQITAQLQTNLVAATGVQIPVQASTPLIEKPIEVTQSHLEAATSSGPVVSNIRDSKSFEQSGSVDEEPLEKQHIGHDEKLKHLTKATQDDVAAEDVTLQESNDTSTASLKELAGMKSSEASDLEGAQINKTETLKTLNQSKETLSTVQVNLMQHITEYVSDGTFKVLNEISSAMNAEELKNCLNTAHELKKCITAILSNTNEETVDKMVDHDKQQLELAQSLEVALSILNKDTLENLHELVPSINKDMTEKIVANIDNLKCNLAYLKTAHHEVLQIANIINEEFKTESETTELVKKDATGTLQKAQFLSEDTNKAAVEITQTDAAEGITLIPVEPMLKTVVTSAPIYTEFSEDLIETTETMAQEIVSKQGEPATVKKCQTDKTSEELLVGHAVSISTSEKTLEIDQTESCVEETSHDTISQEIHFSEIARETAAAGKTATIRDKVATSEGGTPEGNIEVGLIVVTDEKVDQMTATSGLLITDERNNDSFQLLSKSTAVAEPYVSKLIIPNTSGKAVSPEEQNTETSTEFSVKTTTGTLTQNTKVMFPDAELQILFKQPVVEEFKTAALIAKDLQSYLTCSQINRADETQKKPRDKLGQVDLIQQLQQALSSVQVSLLESTLESSTSLNNEQQKFANVVQLADKLSIALSSETISQTVIIDSSIGELRENPQTEETTENVISDNICIAEVHQNTPVSSSQNGQLVQICKHQSLLDLVDEFVDCYSELTDSFKESFDLSSLNKSIEQNISETVNNQTVKPFEEFFDSPTLADKLPSAELIAADVRETTVLENTKNLENMDKSTELATIGLSDFMTSAVTNEINVSDVTKASEEVVVFSNIENLLPENSTLTNIEENSTHESRATQKNDALSYDAKSLWIKEAVIIDPNSDITIKKECPASEGIATESTLAEKSLTVEINVDIVDIPVTRDHVIRFATENESESLYSSPSEVTENRKNKAFLLKHIEEYIASEDVMILAQGFSSAPAIHINLKNSLQIAHHLYEALKLPQISMENIRQELMFKFHSELCCTQSQLSDCVCEFGSINKENLEKVASIITILKNEINELILTSNEILQEVMNEVNEFFTDYSAEHDRINPILETKILTDMSQDVKFNEIDDVAHVNTGPLPVFEQHTGQITNVPEQTNIDVKIEEFEIANEKTGASEDIKSHKTAVYEVQNFDERSNLIQYIDAFIADEMTELINEISNISNTETLKETVAVAKKLRESVTVIDYSAAAEETSSLNDNVFGEQVQLAQTLQDAFSLWHTQKLEISEVIAPDTLDKVSKIISHLQDSLTSSTIISEATPGKIQIEDIGDIVQVEEQNSMAQLEKLLQEVDLKIHIAPADRTIDVDESESLKNTLDEVQTVIIKLKREYDGGNNDTLNETLDDLECSVRSVQLQISEESPPELLSEACATLHLLVDNMNATQQVKITPSLRNSEKIEIFLEKCSDETEVTVKLLDVASKLDTNGNNNMENILSKLNNIKDSLKFLRESFLVDADTVIENGVVIVQSLNQVEENIFSLDGEIEMADGIPGDTRDCIISAVHSVFGSISNMRSAVSSVQKRFMFENYGKPSESLLHSIKNVTTISSFDDEENKASWKRFSSSLRKVLNHFEDIKFYINLDKTARLPSDAAFTKIILEDLKDNIFSLPRAMLLDSNVSQKVTELHKCVDIHIKSIESDSSLQVKNKMPIFKNIATETLTATNFIKTFLEKSKGTAGKPSEGTQPPSVTLIHEQESQELNQELKKPAIAIKTKLGEPSMAFLSEIMRESASVDENKDTEIVELTAIGENVPSTSYLENDAPNTSRKYLTETEILVPLEKPVQISETKHEMHISETFTDSKKVLTLDPENLDIITLQSTEIDERKPPQTTSDVRSSDISDLKAITKEKVKSKDDKDTKNYSQTEIEYDITESESSTPMKTADTSDTPGCSITQIQETKTIEIEKGDEVIASSSKENTRAHKDQVEILDEQEIPDIKEKLAVVQFSFLEEKGTEQKTTGSCTEEEELINVQENKANIKQKMVEADEVEKIKRDAKSQINSNEKDEEKKNQEVDKAKQDQEDSQLASQKNIDTLKAEQDTELKEKELETQNQTTEPDKNSTEQKSNTDDTLTTHEMDVTEDKVKIDKQAAKKNMQEDELKQKAEKAVTKHAIDDGEFKPNQKKDEHAFEKDFYALEAIKQDGDLKHEEKKPNDGLNESKEQKTSATKDNNQEVAKKYEQETEINQKIEEDCANKETANPELRQKQEEKESASTEEIKDEKTADKMKQGDEKDEKLRSKQEKHDAELKLKQAEEHAFTEKANATQTSNDVQIKETIENRTVKEEEEKGQNKRMVYEVGENKSVGIIEDEDIAEETKQEGVSKYKDHDKPERNDACLKQNQMEGFLKEEAEVLQAKPGTLVQQNEGEIRSLKEVADADGKEELESRVIEKHGAIKTKTDMETTENVNQEPEIKEKENYAQQERRDTELNQKEEKTELALMEDTDANKGRLDAKLEEIMPLHEAISDPDKEDKQETELKQTEEKALANKDRALNEDTGALQAKYDAEQNERNDAELKQQQDEKERILKKVADAMNKNQALKEEADALQAKQEAEQKERIDAELKQQQEEKERTLKKVADAINTKRALKEEADALQAKQDDEHKVKARLSNETKKATEDKEPAEKTKQETELKQIEEKAQANQEQNDAQIKQKQEEKERALKEEADLLKARQAAEQKEKARLSKVTADVDLKEKEEQKDRVTKPKSKKAKEDKEAAEKAKKETELKRMEDEARANQEKNDAQLRQKQEEKERALKEEADVLKAKHDAEQKEKTHLLNEALDADLKEKDRVTKAKSKKATEDKEAAEKAKQKTELKHMEDETRANQEQNDAQLKQKQVENERTLKEEADVLKAKHDAERKEKIGLLKETDDADLKEEEEQKDRVTKAKSKMAKDDKEAAEKAKQENELKQMEDEARANQEQNDAQLKQKQEEKERALKEEADVLKAKHDTEQKEKTRLLRETVDADLKEKEEQKDRVTKAKSKKAKEDKEAAEKAKKETELKRMEDEARANQEKNDAQLRLKQEEKERALKEEADVLKAKHDAEQKEKSRLLKETVDADLKKKEEQKDSATKAKSKKATEDKEAAEKATQETELKQMEDEARANQEKNDAQLKQKQEENERALKEEADVLKAKHDAEQKEKTRLLKETVDADLKEKEEQKDRVTKAKSKKAKEDKEAAEKAEKETELKQLEDETRANQEQNDAQLKQKQEEKERALKEEADVLKAKHDAEQKEKTRLLKETVDADLKEKEEQKDRVTKAKSKKAKEDKEAAEKATQETELKRMEDEARAYQEKNDAQLKQKQEENERALKEEADVLKAKHDAEQKEKTRLLKETVDADLKEKEEQKDRVTKAKSKKAKEDKEAAEKAEKETELKQLEDETRANQEQNDAQLKQKQEEKERALKEEADVLKAKHDAEQKEKTRLLKETVDADLKEKEEQKDRVTKAKSKKAKEDKEAAEKAKKETELKRMEDEARANQEKNDAQLRLKQEEKERALKEEADVLKAKHDAEQKEKSRLLKETVDADLKKKKEQKDSATKAKSKKATEDKEAAEKATQETELKRMEDEARANQEKNDAQLKQKQEENERALKEEADVLKAKHDAEQKEKTLLLKETVDADLKEKEEQKDRVTKAKSKKAKEDKEAAEKAEKETELKQLEDETRANQEQNDAQLKQKQEEKERALKEEADVLKAKHDAEQKEKSRLLKETVDADLKEKEKQKDRVTKAKSKKAIEDKEAAEKAKKETELKQLEDETRANQEQSDAELKQKQEEKDRALKDETDVLQSNQDAEQKGKRCFEETNIAFKEKEEPEARGSLTKREKTKREKEENLSNQTKTLKKHEKKDDIIQKEIINRDELTKKNKAQEILKKAAKHTERLDKIERRDDEFHIYKEDSDRLAKKENGDVYHKIKSELSHEEHYIREYQYEPSQTGLKLEAKEKPRFVDHNHRDYTMEFARPSGYREKSFDVNKTDTSLGSHDHLGRNAAIYRAQTLVLDSQLRSSSHLLPDPYGSRTSEPLDRRSEIRHRSKAHSEARSITSEKRTGASRDSKRKPVFSTYLTDRTAVEGSRVKLTCSVLSSSDPTVTWYKNGVELDNKLKYRTKFMDGLITMEVLNAVPSDSAEYSCTIQNENGSVSSSANLKVYPSFEASPIPPTFTRSIRDTFHLAENELVLECRIRGQPLPTITWLKDDKSISTNSRYQAYYLADGVCRLAIEHPSPDDSGKYTCKAENSVWSDQITHVVNFTGKESRLGPNVATIEKSRFDRQVMESRRPHFTNVLSDYKVATGGTIGLQVEIRGAPTRVEWLREGCSVTEVYRNAKTFVEQELYTLALSDVTEKESGMYTCRAWSSQCHVDMNAAITVVQPNELDGKPAIIVGRPEKGILISVGEDINISFRVQGEPKPKVLFMKGIRDITTSQRVCKMTSDDYVKFTLKRSVVSDAGTYCILARNAYGCDRAFVTVVVRQRASSDNLISDWTYPTEDSTISTADRKYKSVPERIPGVPCVVEGGNNWISLGWPKSEPGQSAPVLAYKVESWLMGKEGGARWVELGITPLNSFDAFNLKQGEEYHFRVTPRNRYGWGESVQTLSPAGVGLAGDRPEFVDSLPGQLKVLVGETANLSCSVKGTPAPEVVWMKNGHEIEDEERRLSSSFNGIQCSLTIKDINIEDEARYSCEATNVHGRASTYARLAVVTDRTIWEADAKLKRERSAGVEGDYPPQFTMRLRDRRVQATYPVRLTCQVIGSPDPRITWFKDGGEVTPDNRRSHFQDEHFHTLEIAPTTLEDGGVYEAMARNSSGAVSCHCSLVVDKGIRAYVAPEFCCGLEPLYRLTDGEELRISAVVEAYPSVGVTWYRDGVRLRPSRRAIMTLDRDGQIELALAAVTSRDAGVYSCTASNEVGRASTSGKVEVIGSNVTRTPPVFISPDEPYSKEPMFIRKPRSSEAREGDTVIIECEVVGDPKPDVYWLRDFLKPDYYRDSSHFKRMGDGPEYRFEIPHAKLDYTGAYSVVARNQHGEAKAVISLQILAKDPSSNDDAHNIRYGLVEVLPRFSKELTDLLSCDGDAVEFECRVSGHPEPTVRWFHYNELIRDSPDFETVFDEETARLKIKQVTAEDEGTYTCEAANNLGKVTSSACLVVYPPGEPNTLSQRLRRPPAFLSAASTPRSTPRSTPARSVSRTPGPETRRLCSPARTLAPSFYTYPFNKVAEEGESVSLQCAIKGNPAPWATWDKDGVIITPSSRITIKEKDDVLRILEIDEVTIDDVGVYRITIENEFGRQEASARIEVITQKGKFYAGVRAVSPSPRKSLIYRSRRPSTPRQD